jgi:hypothetical protein
MTKHGIAKRNDDSRAEPNSILRVVLIEHAVRQHLKAEPGTLFSLERLCDAAQGEEAQKHQGEARHVTLAAS